MPLSDLPYSPPRPRPRAPQPPTPLEPLPFRFSIRVYWEDTDAGGVVFYANYLKFFERARTEWLRSLGASQERLRVDDRVMFMVTDTSVRFLAPARLDDALEINVVLRESGRVRLGLAQQAWRHADGQSRLLAEGQIRIACVDAATARPCRIPKPLLGLIERPQAPPAE